MHATRYAGLLRSHLQLLKLLEVQQQGHHAVKRLLAGDVAQPQPLQPSARACRHDQRKSNVRLPGHGQGQLGDVILTVTVQLAEEREEGILDGRVVVNVVGRIQVITDFKVVNFHNIDPREAATAAAAEVLRICASGGGASVMCARAFKHERSHHSEHACSRTVLPLWRHGAAT
jgi:hypothetical protein